MELPIDSLNFPWVDSPFFESHLARSDLDGPTKEMIRSYADDGYIIIDPEIESFDALAREIIDTCSHDPEYQTRLMDEWERIPAVKTLAIASKILSTLATLYRRKPIPMQTLNFARGTQQLAHSDSMHFNCIPRGFMCGVWIALEDTDEENGPLEYYPGSHKLPYFDHSHLGITASSQQQHEHYPQYEQFIQTCIEELSLEKRLLIARKGQAIIWAGNLLHGGSPVKDSSRTRHSQVTHYYFENCLYYQPQRSDPFLGQIEWLHKRDIRTGQYIPHVYNGKLARLPLTLRQRLKLYAKQSRTIRIFRHSRIAESVLRTLRRSMKLSL